LVVIIANATKCNATAAITDKLARTCRKKDLELIKEHVMKENDRLSSFALSKLILSCLVLALSKLILSGLVQSFDGQLLLCKN
jgi:hypothetical protein